MLSEKSKTLASILDANEKYREYLYAKGYLITTAEIIDTDSFPFYGNWVQKKIQNYKFYLHPRQCLYSLSKRGKSYFVIGHCYNPISMKEKEETILEELVECQTDKEYFEKVSELTGIFVTGYIEENNIYMLGDATCMQTMFYGNIEGDFYATSHSQLLGDICGLEFDEYIERLTHYQFYHLFGIMLPGNMTPYEKVKRLIPNHQIAYQNGELSCRRFWPINKIDICSTDKEYKDIIANATNLLQNNLQLTTLKWNKEKVAISMTGGCDSKTTLSCAKEVYDKFDYFSYTSSEAENIDAEAARQICEKLNLPHKIYQIPEHDEEYADIEIWRSILEQNTGNIGKQNKNDVRKRIFFTQHRDFDVEVKSWVSEVARAYYNKRFKKRSFPIKVKARYLTTMYKVFFTERKLVKDTDKVFEAYLQQYYNDDVLGKVSWTDLLFWEYRVGAWNGLVISNEHSLSYDITIPYNNRKILELLLSAPLEKRIDDVCHKDIQKLANIEIANMDMSVTNLKHTTKRAYIERLYYEVQSRLPF